MAEDAKVPRGKCRDCGAPMELALLENSRDKIAKCRHCDATVDLADAQGTTWEKHEKRPDGTVVRETRTEWSSNSPMPGFDGPSPLDDAPDGGPFSLTIDGRDFTSIEEARAHLLKSMPPDAVDHMLSVMKGGRFETTRDSATIKTTNSESLNIDPPGSGREP